MLVYLNSSLQLSPAVMDELCTAYPFMRPCWQLNILGDQNSTDRDEDATEKAREWLRDAINPKPYTDAIMLNIEKEPHYSDPDFWLWEAEQVRAVYPTATIGYYQTIPIHQNGNLYQSQPAKVMNGPDVGAVFYSVYDDVADTGDPEQDEESGSRYWQYVGLSVQTNELYQPSLDQIACISRRINGNESMPLLSLEEWEGNCLTVLNRDAVTHLLSRHCPRQLR
jgi:hypothetical protein